MNYNIRLAHLFITMACPNECEHCLFACSVNDSWMSNDLIEKTIKEFKDNNVINVRIMGGEPFFNLEKFFFAFNTLQKYYKRGDIITITSGFFAKNQKITDEIMRQLEGIKRIELSVDRFHQKKVPKKYIINLMEATKKYDIPVSFSFMIDDMTSDDLIKFMAYLVNKYENSYFHVQKLDIKGRAEKFDYSINKNFEKLSGYLTSLIKREVHPIDQEKINNELKIMLSVLPNGDVFSCCDALKNTYIGNIKKSPLNKLIEKSIGSMANKFIEIGCNNFRFLSPLDKDKCDMCRDFPMKENLEISTKKWIGRIFIEIDENKLDDLEMLKTKIKRLSTRELLIRFKFNDINKAKKYKDKILYILDWMKLDKIRFRISRPLPPCIINNETLNRFQIPKNCYECHELFSIENGKVIACPYHFKIELGNFNNFKNRKEIYEEFIRKIKIMEFNKCCRTCIYKTRNKCEIPCINLIAK